MIHGNHHLLDGD
ncbi:hypothetical protein D047_1962A, partial [Vibrio parahaemolyticus VPTS-2010_2]